MARTKAGKKANKAKAKAVECPAVTRTVTRRCGDKKKQGECSQETQATSIAHLRVKIMPTLLYNVKIRST
jgi:hypothetical protein